MTTVAVKPDLLRWAIDRSGLSIEDLRAKFPKIDDWTRGDKKPTFRQLEQFARATMTPFGAMFLEAPPLEQLPVPDFRTKNETRLKRYSPNLLETIQTMQQRQAWMREWLIDEESKPLDFVGSATAGSNVKSLAQRIRQRLELDTDWAERQTNWEDSLQTLRRAMERIGILVFSNSVVGLKNHRPLDPEEFRGFVLCDPIAPVIFINDADTKSARIFTLAHELVHVWLGTDGVFNLKQCLPADHDVERFCNRVAAEFLIPEYKLTAIWDEVRKTEKPFHAIARRFKVSPLVAARRALDLEFISRKAFFQFYEDDQEDWIKQKEKNRRKRSGGDFYATQNVRLGNTFPAAVVRATLAGRILYEEAFQLTGIQGEPFHKYAELVRQRVRDERE